MGFEGLRGKKRRKGWGMFSEGHRYKTRERIEETWLGLDGGGGGGLRSSRGCFAGASSSSEVSRGGKLSAPRGRGGGGEGSCMSVADASMCSDHTANA